MSQELQVGDRVMCTNIMQKATIVKVVKSAILPDWTCAYLVKYDHPPPVEFNMGSLDGICFPKKLVKLDEHERTPKRKRK